MSTTNVGRTVSRAGRSALSILAAGLVAAGVSPAAWGQGGPPPAAVVVDVVRSETIEKVREATGEIHAVRRANLATQTDGLVVELLVEAGDRVRVGDPIARLRETTVRLDLDRALAAERAAAATVVERETDVQRLSRELERVRDAHSRASTSINELDKATFDHGMANARHERAKADLVVAQNDVALARERLDQHTIRAPIEGVVTRKNTEIGQWIHRGDAVVEIITLGEVDAWLDVPERFIDRLREVGMTVQVRVPALGEVFEAAITSIVPSADPRSRLFPVRVRLANPEHRLHPGMSAVGLIPTGGFEPTLTVHKDAVLRDDAGTFVYFDAGGMAMPARIDPIFAVGNRVAIRPGMLRAGTAVVIEGNERMFPSQPLRILNPAPADGASAAAPGTPGTTGPGGR